VVAGVVVALLLVLGAALWPADEAGRRTAPEADRTGPIAVLRAWDRDRAAAWRAGDPAALRELYVPGSRAGAADRAMLAAYADRGLRVTGMRMQVAAARVHSRGDERIVLLVTDRLASAEVHGPDGVVPLPVDRWSSRRVVLLRTGERWRVARVTGQDSADAITAEASGSSKR
jgi:hypothetical protein